MKALASDSLADPEACKTYLALVLGTMAPLSGTIDLPIARPFEMDMRRVVSPDGQRAVTHYETVCAGSVQGHRISLLSLTLETGRTHQIRVHCHHLGHPILGDILYHTDESQAASEKLGIETQALFARQLTFSHPLTGEIINIEAPEPEVFSQIRPFLV
jgi:23S rRNA pseudouridine1911/1915/1917 synthase